MQTTTVNDEEVIVAKFVIKKRRERYKLTSTCAALFAGRLIIARTSQLA